METLAKIMNATVNLNPVLTLCTKQNITFCTQSKCRPASHALSKGRSTVQVCKLAIVEHKATLKRVPTASVLSARNHFLFAVNHDFREV